MSVLSKPMSRKEESGPGSYGLGAVADEPTPEKPDGHEGDDLDESSRAHRRKRSSSGVQPSDQSDDDEEGSSDEEEGEYDGDDADDEDTRRPGENRKYQYRDHASAPIAAPGSRKKHGKEDETRSQGPSRSARRKSQPSRKRFPAKLYLMLSTPQFSHIVSWLPHGRSWKIWNIPLLEEKVLPHFFDNSNYNSFLRLVNAWRFRRIRNKNKRQSPDYNSYYHELFLRGRPDLCERMKRLPKKAKKLPMDKGDEADFDELPSMPELPGLPNRRIDQPSSLEMSRASSVGMLTRGHDEAKRTSILSEMKTSSPVFGRQLRTSSLPEMGQNPLSIEHFPWINRAIPDTRHLMQPGTNPMMQLADQRSRFGPPQPSVHSISELTGGTRAATEAMGLGPAGPSVFTSGELLRLAEQRRMIRELEIEHQNLIAMRMVERGRQTSMSMLRPESGDNSSLLQQLRRQTSVGGSPTLHPSSDVSSMVGPRGPMHAGGLHQSGTQEHQGLSAPTSSSVYDDPFIRQRIASIQRLQQQDLHNPVRRGNAAAEFGSQLMQARMDIAGFEQHAQMQGEHDFASMRDTDPDEDPRTKRRRTTF